MPKLNLIADYRFLVIFQAVIILSYLFTKDIFILSGWGAIVPFLKLYFIVLAFIYGLLLTNIVNHSSNDKKLRFLITAIILFLVLLTGLLENPFYQFFSNTRPLYFLLHVLLIIVEIVVIYLAIIDLFYGNQSIEMKLWASACIYLTVAMAFGGAYDLANIIEPGSFGPSVSLGFDSYIAGISYSLFMISGIEADLNSSTLMHKISVVESIICNLYLVLLIGQILGGAEQRKN